MTSETQAPLPATFTSAEAAHLGLSRRRLLALQEEGTIERIVAGRAYVLPALSVVRHVTHSLS